ncbi:MAG: glycoside hydrolase, partial [Ignavibacteria bacterium]|nr:glycoside hydrolase [Ignavibacteria bacterium]
MMNKLTTLFLTIILLMCAGNIFAQGQSWDGNIWSIVNIDPNGPIKAESPNWVPAEQTPRFYDLGRGVTVYPNFRPHPTTNTTQSEMSVDVHPANNNIVFSSANASNWPVSTIYGTGVYWSLDGSSTWTGFDQPPFGSNSGDPVSVIGIDGRLYENYISNSLGQGVAVSTNNGVSWTTHTVAPNPGSLADKNHFMVDKTPSSPYVNSSYCVWTDFGGANNYDAVLRYSTNFGQNWSSSINLSNALSSYLNQGANVQTGPNGEVYATWTVYIDGSVTTGEDGIGFAKSTDGGGTWTAPMYVYQQTNFGIRTTSLTGGKGIRCNSFPSMAVDRSGGPENGTIYICWTQRGVSPAGNDPDVVMVKSTDEGATWSSPVRVNDDPLNNAKDQILPWITVDQATGQVILVFYDSRNVPNSQAEVFMASSFNGGATFTNFVVSDQAFVLDPISGFSGNYAGDYIGVAAYNDVAYPYWMDERTGNAQGWMARVEFGPPCPIDPPDNPSPAANAIDIPITGNTLTWTNGAGADSTEIWFGEV